MSSLSSSPGPLHLLVGLKRRTEKAKRRLNGLLTLNQLCGKLKCSYVVATVLESIHNAFGTMSEANILSGLSGVSHSLLRSIIDAFVKVCSRCIQVLVEATVRIMFFFVSMLRVVCVC